MALSGRTRWSCGTSANGTKPSFKSTELMSAFDPKQTLGTRTSLNYRHKNVVQRGQGPMDTKRVGVVVTRRELLTGAIAISGSTLVAKASPLRSVMPEFKLAMTTPFGSVSVPTLKTISFPTTKVIGTRIGKRVTGVLTTLNIEMVIGQQDSGPRKIPSTWRSLMASSPTPTA